MPRQGRTEVSIVSAGMGNVGSIVNMIKKLGYTSRLCATPSELEPAAKLILPGVGRFGRGMEKLHDVGFTSVLDRKVREEKVPILGICLGMQLMGLGSEEDGGVRGFGWIEADFVRFQPNRATGRITVPQMGWNELSFRRPSALFHEMEQPARFYFVHAYHAECRHPEDVIGETEYGYRFAAAFERGNVLGVQFHPEKSHKYGMRLIRNFIERY